jgi:hypothetical protein
VTEHRLMIQIAPEGSSDAWLARLASWINFVLDTRMLPPEPSIPDALNCPYCGTAQHRSYCKYATAFARWGRAQEQIQRDFEAPLAN